MTVKVVKNIDINYLQSLDDFISEMEIRLEKYKKEDKCPCEIDYARIDLKIEEFSQILIDYTLLHLYDGETTNNDLFFRTLKTPYEWEVCEKIQHYKKRLDILYYNYVMQNKYDSRKEMYNHNDELIKATITKLGW